VRRRKNVGQIRVSDRVFGAHPDPGHETRAYQKPRIRCESGDHAPHRKPHQVEQKSAPAPDPVGETTEHRRPDEHAQKRRGKQQLQSPPTKAILRLERGGDSAGQKDLIHLEEEAEPNSDHHFEMHWPNRQVIQAPPNVGQ